MEEHMRHMKRFLILAIVMLGAVAGGFAQNYEAYASVTIEPVAMLNVSTAFDPYFIVEGPGDAGMMPIITPSGGPTYLQYTVVHDADATIQATCSAAMLPGIKLDIWAATPMGTGTPGVPAAGGGLTVTSTSTVLTADIITGILSCATGSGVTQGPAIYYTLSIDASTFAAMEPTATDADYTITYTLLTP